MRYHRDDIVERAVGLLDAYGLGDLSMRRLGADLGVQPSALYHHFANKQTLLAAVADEILRRGARTPPTTADWEEQVRATCGELRDAMLAYRDGAELVATVHAFGLGAQAPGAAVEEILTDAGFGTELSRVAARTLLHYVFGHTSDEQAFLQAASIGAVEAPPRESSDFSLGLGLVLGGLRHRLRSRQNG